MEVTQKQYYLRASFKAHDSDVRALVTAKNLLGGFLSGSRDLSVKLWTPKNNFYEEQACLYGPTNYVSSLCTLPSSDEYPLGLVVAGSHDCAIYGFSLKSFQQVFKLLGHSGTVSALASGAYGTILSGSWDNTAKVWNGQKCVATLSGHQEAVWAVAIFSEDGLMITGSADKTIRSWRSGNIEKVFTGHTGYVRGITIVCPGEFLSCASDGKVRHWQTNGNCLAEYSAHLDTIYDIYPLNETGDFVTCSEDKSVKVWACGMCVAAIEIPASIWSVKVLENGDIVAGASNGWIYVFTLDMNLEAPQEIILQFESQKSKASVNNEGLGDGNGLRNLPGFEMLKQKGIIKGQKVFCRNDEGIIGEFVWDDVQMCWINEIDTSVKVYPDGIKKPDHVFDIDVDGKTLPLQFYNGDNPYTVAETFIQNYNVPSAYKSEIINFIIANTASSVSNNEQGFYDPFTGMNRYIPGSNSNASAAQASSTESKSDPSPPAVQLFPQHTYVSFNFCKDADAIKSKLIQFSKEVDEEYAVSLHEIDGLMLLIDFPDTVAQETMNALQKTMFWPPELVFPALDVFRLAVRSEVVMNKVKEAGENTIYSYMMRQLCKHELFHMNAMFALRALCNMFNHEFGFNLLLSHLETICAEAAECVPTKYKNLEVAAATLFLNYAVALNKTNYKKDVLVKYMCPVLLKLKQHESILRMMIAIGTLLGDDSTAKFLKVPSVVQFVIEYLEQPDAPSAFKKCGEHLLQKLT